MKARDESDRLSQIQTQWALVFEAHQGQGDAGTAAYQQLLLRYYGAVYRYLLAMLRDSVAAEELTQDFACRFLRGDFHRADPHRGRFRDFVKMAVRHLAQDYWARQAREKARGPRPLASGEADGLAGSSGSDDADRSFVEKWREELLAHTWQALETFQETSGHPYHTVLQLKTEHPKLAATKLAELLGHTVGRAYTDEGVRQLLHRARTKFADLLVAEVAHSLQTSDVEALAEELGELDLLCYCQTALDRRQRSG
jgi:RNA polymerase sigma-70 factor (ECF subfamily)